MDGNAAGLLMAGAGWATTLLASSVVELDGARAAELTGAGEAGPVDVGMPKYRLDAS